MEANPTTSLSHRLLRQPSGFTLVELMVTIVIIVVLASLAFMGYGRLKLGAQKAVSINNIRQLSTATMASAGDNNGRFVGIHSQAKLPYRFTRSFRDQYGISKDNAYSNANRCWKTDGRDHCGGRDLWDFTAGDTVFGYCCMVDDSPTADDPGWAVGTFELPDNWDRIKDDVTSTSGRGRPEVRWVAKRASDKVAYPILWTDLCRSLSGQTVGNFMANENEPLGVHVGYIDGHIEWNAGKNVKIRYRGSANVLW